MHEKICHKFERFPEDCKTKEAVKIQKNQLPQLFNVSYLLVDVQKSAIKSAAETKDLDATTEELQQLMDSNPQRPSKKPKKVQTNIKKAQRSSRSNARRDEYPLLESKPVQRPSKRSSAIEVVTLDSSDDEFQPQSTISVRESSPVVQRLNQSAPLSCSLKRVRVLEEITLDDSDDDFLPEPAIQTPQPNIRASQFSCHTPQPTNSTLQLMTSMARSQSFITTPQPTTQNKNRANELMTEMFKKPQFLYYDYKAVGSEFSVLPISIWKNCADCELMVLQLDSANWNGNITLESPFCYFNLNDKFGHFLGFAKPNSQLLADRFKGALSSVTSFKQLLECLHQMDFQSSLIITNELGRT
ncbi:hypothetical protein M3Y98_00694200 [Aphelenchoides besseyi]|nr:hypothetical protein M3Y98_00694200 [Aphelenchoides besseyi]